jgi:hypothetical protein
MLGAKGKVFNLGENCGLLKWKYGKDPIPSCWSYRC